jgi:membrane protease YdiL (CAAX protease family)
MYPLEKTLVCRKVLYLGDYILNNQIKRDNYILIIFFSIYGAISVLSYSIGIFFNVFRYSETAAVLAVSRFFIISYQLLIRLDRNDGYYDDIFGLSRIELLGLLITTVLVSLILFLLDPVVLRGYIISADVNADIKISGLVRASVFEELLFRGVLLSLLFKRMNLKKANLYQAVGFALWHLQALFIHQELYSFILLIALTFLFGLIVGQIRFKFKHGMYICILMHVLIVVINGVFLLIPV